MKKFLLSATFAVLSVASASAADLPARPYAKAPAIVAPVYNWTGCYVGGNVGGIAGADRLTNYPGPTLVAAALLTPAEVASLTHGSTPNEWGFTGGGQVGCNWQGAASPFVVGVEADISGSSLRESVTSAFPVDPLSGFVAHTETNTKDVKWFSTFRARAGYAANRWLVYVTGGLAVAQIDSSLNLPIGAGGAYLGSDSRTRVGYTVGGGVEYAFTGNWSAKLEYLYLDFGKYSFASPLNANPAAVAWATDVSAREHVLRVGLNYHFGGPVVARY